MDRARKQIDKRLKAMERRLSRIYTKASKDIAKEWESYLKAQGELISALQDDYWTYKNAGYTKEAKVIGKQLGIEKANRTLRNKHFQDITESTAERLANVNRIAVDYINDKIPEMYTFGYNAIGDSLIKGISFNMLDEHTLRYLIAGNPKLLPHKSLKRKKDIAWNKKQMNSAVLQGIIQGESMDKIAKRLYPIIGNNEKAAIRNARTMVTSAENKGRQDSYQALEDDGVIMTKVWMATNDGRTREWHAEMDGQEVGINEPFVDGEGNELMYPGDPDAPPETVYNCRCTTTVNIKGFIGSDGRVNYV